MHVTRFRRPDRYSTNEVPYPRAVEMGALKDPTDEARLTLIEIADCVGHQLLRFKENRSEALCAAMLVRLLLNSLDDKVLTQDGRWPNRNTIFQGDVENRLTSVGAQSRSRFEAETPKSSPCAPSEALSSCSNVHVGPFLTKT